MEKTLKTYFRFLVVLLLCGLAYFNANSIIISEVDCTDNSVFNDATSSLSLSSFEVEVSTYNTFKNHDDHHLLFEIVDPQEVEEFESLFNVNLQSSNFETDFSRIQHLKNSFYKLKERSMRFKYNSTKPSSELLVRLQVFII